jgi:methyl acetate hydrolase
MTVRFSRRDTLLRTAAVAAAGLIPGAAFPGLAVPLRTLSRSGEIDAIFQARVDATDVPGVVAMAATEHSVIYQGAFGARSMGTAARMSADTVFSIASMTKLLTSVAALQLVEQDKLKLDEPAARIDPTLGSPQVLDGFDAQGAPQLRAARKPITLRNL